MLRSLALLPLVAGACGVAPDPGLPAPDPLPLEGETFVIDSIDMPDGTEEVYDVAFDLDGNGSPDNSFGHSLSIALTVLGVDGDERVAQSLAAGELLHLLMFSRDSTGEALDTGRLFLGADPDGDPTNNFTGDAELEIRSGAPLLDAAFGVVGNREVTLAGGNLTVENVIFAPVRLPLVGARIEGAFFQDGGFRGRLGGGITRVGVEVLRDVIATAIAGEANEQCDSAQTPCCPIGSRGESYLSVFDGDGDCVLRSAEVRDSDLLRFLTEPDIDADGDFEPDLLSFAVGFTAVSASFEIP